MANWTSINDVIRDLSVAQGSIVPASLEIYGNTPPNLNIDEDAEHDLKSQGDVNFTANTPDFTFIQEMISMVSDNKDKNKLEISRNNLNPFSPEFIPQKKHEMKLLWRTKVARNVALQSILDKLEEKTEKSPDMSKSPSSMFRKKRVASVEKKSTVSVVKSDSVISKCKYTPSVLANEYYNKYIENNKLRDQNKNVIVEPVREIYMRRNPSSEKKFLDYYSSVYCNEETKKGIDYMLERHRHLTIENIEDCVVCSIIDKHGYTFKEDNINIGPWGDGLILKHVTTPTLSDDNITEENSEGS